MQLFEHGTGLGGRRAERRRDAWFLVWIEGTDIRAAAKRMRVLSATVRHHLRKGRCVLIEEILRELGERELDGGPFAQHCRSLRDNGAGDEIDALVRAAARYLLDIDGLIMPTTDVLRSRLGSRMRGNGFE